MAWSTVSLVRYKDSVLVNHGVVKEDDSFEFSSVPVDTYTLLITRAGYADYDEKIIVLPNQTLVIPPVYLITRSNLLKEVLIKEKSNAIRFRGDTTEFLVDSFLTNKNANVEDLLKKLPGIQVDRDGKITAQGQEVKKVLVDGEEFFGEDPTIATKNIRAENVEKIQVFDKKSDQAAFSGIDDGEKTKTINLQLKEDAKKGYFGKLSAGAGTQSRYEHDAMVNIFKNKRKFSVYGAMSNTNKTRLSWDDANKFGGGNNDNMEYDEASGYTYYYYTGDNMNFDGVGIPQTWYTGAHFSDKTPDDVHAYAFNATHKDLQSKGVDLNYSKYILPDTLYFVNQRKDVINHKMQNSFGGTYELKTDSFNTFKMKLNVKDATFSTTVLSTTENYNSNSFLVNRNERTNLSDTRNQSESFSFSWNRKFRTTGRSLMTQFTQNYNNSEGTSYINSALNIYDTAGNVSYSSNIDQQKKVISETKSYNAKFTYTEPLNKYWFIVGEYDGTINSSTSDRVTKAKQNGEYNLLVDSLTNSLKYDIYINKGGLSLKYVKKKFNVSAGGKISYTDLKQTMVQTNVATNQRFFNLFPAASFNYKISNTSNFRLGYNGSTQQPTIQQIQPIQDNSNPLDIYVGNPNLEQSFRNSINMSYNTYKPISGQSFYTSISFSFTNNDFTSFDKVDVYGRKIHQTVNVNGNNGFWMWSSYYFGIKKWHLRFGTSVNANGSTNVNYINGLKNTNQSQSIGFGQNIYYELEKKWEVSVNADWDYNRGTSTIRKDIVTQYWTQSYTTDVTRFLPAKFEVSTDIAFYLRQQTESFSRNLNVVMWNASIRKKFLKSEALVAGIKVYDLLNQNLGFDRNVSSNYINEHTYTVLKNYFLFTLTWNFTKGPVEQDED